MQERFLGWNFPAEHADLVHPHWRVFLAPGRLWHVALAFIYLLLLMLSLVGNGTVIWIFSTSKSLRTPSNIFILNLAVFDLLMAMEMPMLIVNSFLERTIGWETGCDVYALFGGISGMGQSITNAVIAFDRYRTISCPIDGRLNGKQAMVLAFFTWFWTLPFSILPMTGLWGRYVAEGFLTTCSFDYLTDDENTRTFVTSIFVWAYVLPMSLITYFYSQLLMSIRAHIKMLRNQAKKMNVKSLASNKEAKERNIEMRITKAAFTIVFLFVLAWTPYAAVALIGAYGNREILTPLSTMLPAIFAKIVSCIDPWIYAINHPRYRQELEKRCKWMGIQEKMVEDTVSTQTEKVNTEET
ncbi:opsin, blue-sensitive isoform X2 [Monomorium pharaonis]|nr:opsin, blue-sensitive isoform X2 [Monomorium pharaonis]XP_036144478.1 opsin, blue-sensitive isoform X2 [Monomorium pharaonis]XP_036144479.1 opsin, blue-sensitive isoform X2 [Monomorium pharaonis]XP_036144480.1 opsin, blue-sensitive isoform X2 [Monomorium pharaonis]XP_036144481.1 opsin, blue-sensitive isoform X2 [Monomorium pharaonis]